MGGICKYCRRSLPKTNSACDCPGAMKEYERIRSDHGEAARPLCQMCVDADRPHPSIGFKRDVSGVPLCHECYADVAASMPAAQPAKEGK